MQLQAIPADNNCLLAWVAGQPTSPDCAAAVEKFAAVNEDIAAKVMVAMAILPFAIGAIVGSPLIARELEEGTAPVTWSLAGSRGRWFALRFAPALLLVIALCVLLAVSSTILVHARTAGGIWLSPYDLANLYGVPLVAHGVVSLALGAFFGALIGRTLASLLATTITISILFVVVMEFQVSYVHRTFVMDINAPGYISRFLAFNPDTDVRLVSPSGRVLTLQEALEEAPSGTEQLGDWLQDNGFRLVALGVKPERATDWQVVETAGYLVIAVLATAGSLLVLARRKPG